MKQEPKQIICEKCKKKTISMFWIKEKKYWLCNKHYLQEDKKDNGRRQTTTNQKR